MERGDLKMPLKGVTCGFLQLLALCLGLSVLAAIALGARRSTKSSPAWRLIGAALIAVPLPLAIALHLLVWPASAYDQIAFVVGVVAFGAGALLVLPGEDRDEPAELPDDPDPAPWWPDFEREFRQYVLTARVPTRIPAR